VGDRRISAEEPQGRALSTGNALAIATPNARSIISHNLWRHLSQEWAIAPKSQKYLKNNRAPLFTAPRNALLATICSDL